MELTKAIESRFSSRSYSSKSFPVSVISQILELAIKCPNAGNLHSYRFVVIDEEDLKIKVAKASMNQLWMAEAPYLIVVCYDDTSLKRYYEDQGHHYGEQDAVVVSSYITLVAKEFDLDTCFVSAFEPEEISRLTRLPGNVHPEVIIPIGYTREKKKFQYRPSIDLLGFYNEYGNKSFRKTLEEKAKELPKSAKSDLKSKVQKINLDKVKGFFKKKKP